MTTNPESARIRKISAPVNTPGSCGVCGKSQHDEGFAYTDNFDFEYYGSLIFCADCVGDYARLFGYLSPKVAQVQQNELDALKAEVLTLRQAVVLLENTVDNFTGLSVLAATMPDSSVSVSSDDLVANETEHESAKESDATGSGVVPDPPSGGEEDKRASDEPVIEQGPDDVRNSPISNDELADLLA